MIENVLEEAQRLVDGDRNESYGPPLHDAERFARIARELTGLDVQPEDYPLLMIAVKLARHAHSPQRDNLVDLAGYALIAERIDRERK